MCMKNSFGGVTSVVCRWRPCLLVMLKNLSRSQLTVTLNFLEIDRAYPIDSPEEIVLRRVFHSRDNRERVYLYTIEEVACLKII